MLCLFQGVVSGGTRCLTYALWWCFLITGQWVVWFPHYVVINFCLEANKQYVERHCETMQTLMFFIKSSPTPCLHIYPLIIFAQTSVYYNRSKMTILQLQDPFQGYCFLFDSKEESFTLLYLSPCGPIVSYFIWFYCPYLLR